MPHSAPFRSRSILPHYPDLLDCKRLFQKEPSDFPRAIRPYQRYGSPAPGSPSGRNRGRGDNRRQEGGAPRYYKPMTTYDQPRLVATASDSEFTLTIDDALSLYAEAGIPRTPRSVQRYCAKQHLSSRRIETEFGEKYLIERASVLKHIAYIKEVTPATSRDVPRPVATTVAGENMDDTQRQEAATTIDQSRPVATSPDLSRYIARLENDVDFLRGQMDTKDNQIKEMTDRARETNVLIAGLQKMLTPLLGTPKERRDDAEASSDQPH
jgi:hypothetical protein